jgi:5-methylcytosine-specific restriction endonuclease McrA
LARTETERKEYNRLRQQKLVASYSPERLAAYKEKGRLFQAKRRALRTPEQHDADKEVAKTWFQEHKNDPKYRERRLRQGKEHYYRHQDKYKAQEVEKNAALRREVIQSLGGKCSSCQLLDHRALEIDHINGDGYLERGSKVHSSSRYKKILALENKSEKYQILCGSCHNIKTYENGEHRRAASRPNPSGAVAETN